MLLLGFPMVRLPEGESREVMKAVDSPRDWAVMYWAVTELRKERVHRELAVEAAEAEELRRRMDERAAREQVGRANRTMAAVCRCWQRGLGGYQGEYGGVTCRSSE